MGETRSKILFRAVEEFERLRGSNLAWFGLDELTYTSEEAWLRLEGRLRDPKAARLCGFAVWTPKGYDWVYERFVAERVDGYEVVTAKAFENRHLLERVPDYYERLKSSYDPRFYQQEVLGRVSASARGAGVLRLRAGEECCRSEGGPEAGAAVGAGLQRGSDVLGGGAGGGRGGAGAGRDRAEPGDDAAGVRGVSEPVSGARRGAEGVCGRVGSAHADDGDVGSSCAEEVLSERGVRDGGVQGSEVESGGAGSGAGGQRGVAAGGRGHAADRSMRGARS